MTWFLSLRLELCVDLFAGSNVPVRQYLLAPIHRHGQSREPGDLLGQRFA